MLAYWHTSIGQVDAIPLPDVDLECWPTGIKHRAGCAKLDAMASFQVWRHTAVPVERSATVRVEVRFRRARLARLRAVRYARPYPRQPCAPKSAEPARPARASEPCNQVDGGRDSRQNRHDRYCLSNVNQNLTSWDCNGYDSCRGQVVAILRDVPTRCSRAGSKSSRPIRPAKSVQPPAPSTLLFQRSGG